MSLPTPPETAAPPPATGPEVRPAATVLLLRDGEGGVEVLMMQRHIDSVFAAGVWVFPGGRVDAADGGEHPGGASAPPDDRASEMVGVAGGGRAFWVAAARESFEEAGLLLAVDAATGLPVDGRDPALTQRLARRRVDLLAGACSFGEVLAAEGLALTLADVHVASRWITPPGPPRRFDTRFFVAPAPAGQEPSHEGAETVDWVWTTPQQAFDRFRAGQIELMRPTIAQLASMADFTSTAAVLDAVRTFGPREPIAPSKPRGPASAEIEAALEERWPI